MPLSIVRAKAPADEFSFCEPICNPVSHATHIRLLLDGQRRIGGKLSGTCLCGRYAAGGWDLTEAVDETSIRELLAAEHHPLCEECVTVWWAMTGP